MTRYILMALLLTFSVARPTEVLASDPVGQAKIVAPGFDSQAQRAGSTITPLDRMQVTVFREPELSVEDVQVDEGGKVLLPLVGPLSAAGKSTESDYVFDRAAETVTSWGRSTKAQGYGDLFEPGAGLRERLAERELPGLATGTAPDLCEMTIVANCCDLAPDRPELHAPVARTTELPQVFSPQGDGGILDRMGVVDVFAHLRRTDELSFAGGVFVVVEAPDPATGRLLAGKGIPGAAEGRYLLLHNPVHLLGVEAVASVLAAARGAAPLGDEEVRPRFDLAARAARDIAAGEVLAS